MEMVWQERQDYTCHVEANRSRGYRNSPSWCALRWSMDNGSTNLYFNYAEFAYFDIYILKREGAREAWEKFQFPEGWGEGRSVIAECDELAKTMTPEKDHKLVENIVNWVFHVSYVLRRISSGSSMQCPTSIMVLPSVLVHSLLVHIIMLWRWRRSLLLVLTSFTCAHVISSPMVTSQRHHIWEDVRISLSCAGSSRKKTHSCQCA